MAKRKKIDERIALGPKGLITISAEDIREMTSRLKVVRYPRVDNVEVKLCMLDEEALGLGKFTCGFCKKGLYVRDDRTPSQARLFMKSIDWLRVVRVKTNFDVRATGYVLIRDSKCWFISEKRYIKLLKHCSLTYLEEEFNHEIDKAIADCKRNGQSPTNISGQLEEEIH